MNTPTSKEEALLWLAGLERTTCGYPDTPRCWCVEGDCPCHSLDFNEVHGKVPVLDLREPCPCLNKDKHIIDLGHWRSLGGCDNCWSRWFSKVGFHDSCTSCGGINWLPKQGREALHAAMLKDGWRFDITEFPLAYDDEAYAGQRIVSFIKGEGDWFGEYGDDYIAAMKAMQAAGYR